MRHLIFALPLSLFLSCVVNSEADCTTLCEWWKKACTGETLESCVSDCRETTESAKDGITRCVEGQGWNPNPSTCQSAGCCLRFVYDDYQARCVG